MPVRLPSFWIKVGLALAVVAAADLLLFGLEGIGLNLGLFSLALVAAVVIGSPAARRHPLSRPALAAATLFAALQIERATFLGWLLFALSLAVAALAPRAPAGDDGWRWAQRLVVSGLKALVGPVFDALRLQKARGRGAPLKLGRLALSAALPVVGGAVFVLLFAAANPVIQYALGGVHVPEPDVGRLVFWAAAGLIAWAVLRPRGLRRTLSTPGLDGDLKAGWITPMSVAASLAVFNLIFAVQNGLDVAFLWSGAGLPEGVSFSEYAHRGAEPLIATALLAGLFVLIFLRPGSATAASGSIRAMVILWIAQNLFLVASTALRTLDYIDAYSLTRTRIAALLWMALVATGLVLITWRLLRARSSSWLINTNLAAAGVVLAVCSVIDLGAVAAAWNVRHAREVGGRGVALDLAYFWEIEGAGVVSLAKLERRPDLGPVFRCEVNRRRVEIETRMADRQTDWRSWRWRDARRLAELRRITGRPPMTAQEQRRLPPCIPAKPPTPALTATPNPGN